MTLGLGITAMEGKQSMEERGRRDKTTRREKRRGRGPGQNKRTMSVVTAWLLGTGAVVSGKSDAGPLPTGGTDPKSATVLPHQEWWGGDFQY